MNNCGWRRRSTDRRYRAARRLATIATLALVALASGGCGHSVFSSNSSSSSGGGGGSGTLRSVYVTNSSDGKVSALHNSGGTLSSPVSFATGALNGPLGLALATPTGANRPLALYVVNPADNMIHQFNVSSTGNLSALATITAGSKPQQVVVTPNGSFAYAINAGGSISQYLINSANGQLSANAPAAIVSGLIAPVSAVATQDSSLLYVTDPSGGAGLVLTFAIASSGALSFTSSVATGGANPGQIAIDAVTGGSTWVFVADATSGVVTVLQATGSALSLVATIGTGGSAGGMALAMTSGGTFLFVANPALNSVASFSLNTATGILGALAVTPGFSTPTGLAVDSTSTTLFVTNNSNGTVTTLSITANGSLSPINSFATESPANAASSPEYVVTS